MTEVQIKAIIDENIRTNGREEITGAIANNVLNAMIDYTTTVVTPTIDVSGAIAVGQVSTAVNGDKIARYLPTKSITKFDSAYAGLVGGYSQGNIVIYNDEIYVSESNNNLTTPSSSSMTWRKLSSGGYTLPTASTTVLGGVKVDGSTIIIDNNGVISSTGGGGGGYVLPEATSVVLGGVKIDNSTIIKNISGQIVANNLYSANGTITTNRSVGLSGNKLSFNNGITKVDRLELTKLTSNLNPNTLYTDGIDVFLTNEFGVTEKLLRKVDSYEWGRQLTPEDEDITIGSYRGMIVNRRLKIKNFFITASNAPSGSGIILGMQKNNVTITTINATILPNNKTSASNATQPTFSSDTFEIGDEIRFFIPAGGIGSVNAGQNLEVYLEFEKL